MPSSLFLPPLFSASSSGWSQICFNAPLHFYLLPCVFLIYFTPNLWLLADFLSTLLAGRLERTILRAFQLNHELACLTEWTSQPAIHKSFH